MAHGRHRRAGRQCVLLPDDGVAISCGDVALPEEARWWRIERLAHEGGDEDEVDALRFDLRQDLGEYVQRGGVRMADGDGLTFIFCAANSQLELLADFRGVLHIV